MQPRPGLEPSIGKKKRYFIGCFSRTLLLSERERLLDKFKSCIQTKRGQRGRIEILKTRGVIKTRARTSTCTDPQLVCWRAVV
jgi:hypothetical protein